MLPVAAMPVVPVIRVLAVPVDPAAIVAIAARVAIVAPAVIVVDIVVVDTVVVDIVVAGTPVEVTPAEDTPEVAEEATRVEEVMAVDTDKKKGADAPFFYFPSKALTKAVRSKSCRSVIFSPRPM